MNKDQAIEILKEANLFEGIIGGCPTGEYLSYRPGWIKATLDGDFTADQLEAIALLMRSPPGL